MAVSTCGAALDDVLDFLRPSLQQFRPSCGRAGLPSLPYLPSESLTRSCAGHWLDHDLHGIRLRMRCDIDGRNCFFQRKTVRDELREIEAVAVAAEN